MPTHAHIAAAVTVALVALATALPINAHAQTRGDLGSDIASGVYAQSDRQDGIKQTLKLSAEQERFRVSTPPQGRSGHSRARSGEV